MRPHRYLLTCLGCALLLFSICTEALARQENNRYFPETGHNLTGIFLQYYESIPHAGVVFGLPITEAFVTSHPSGMTVQYFQRARFEYHPGQPAGEQVRLTSLGKLLYQKGTPGLNMRDAKACRVFSSGYSVCLDFLTFYDAYGGLETFGYPISGFEFQRDGRIMQYFERARFEWHPELPRGQNVLLSGLGGMYFYHVSEDPARIAKVPPSGQTLTLADQNVLGLDTVVFVEKAILLPGDTQTIYIIVRDQALAPLEGASGNVTIDLPGSRDLVFPVTTLANGTAILTGITLEPFLGGTRIPVVVHMTYQGLQDHTEIVFRLWR